MTVKLIRSIRLARRFDPQLAGAFINAAKATVVGLMNPAPRMPAIKGPDWPQYAGAKPMGLPTTHAAKHDDFVVRGLDLFHDMVLLTDGWAGWETVSQRIQEIGGAFVSVRATLVHGTLSAHCRVANLSAQSARALADKLMAEGACRNVRVDHVYLARSTPR